MHQEESQYHILRLKNQEDIDRTIRSCGDAFPTNPVSQRENYPQLLHKLSHYAVFFVAQDREPLGYGAMYANDFEKKTAFMTLLAVRPEHQGKHIGAALMNRCLNYARNCGMEVVRLEVRKDNPRAIGMYQAFGFREEAETSESSIFMKKSLSEDER